MIVEKKAKPNLNEQAMRDSIREAIHRWYGPDRRCAAVIDEAIASYQEKEAAADAQRS